MTQPRSRAGTSGRALRPVSQVPRGPVWCAVELLPGAVQGALVDLRGHILSRCQRSFDPDGALPQVKQAIAEVVAGSAMPPLSVKGCGVASGGIIDADAGVIVEINDVPCLDGFDIAGFMATLVPAPVRVEHRARLQVMGDRWFGPGRGLATFASVSTGATLGVGILYEGAILAPDGGRSGAHMTVAAGGPLCTCGKRGCWKAVATTSWLEAAAVEAGLGVATLAELEELAGGTEVSGSQNQPENQRFAAREVLDRYAENLAVGLANIQQLCAPGLFILHGEAATASAGFRSRVEQVLAESTRSAAHRQPRVTAASVGVDDVALLGAAALVIHQ